MVNNFTETNSNNRTIRLVKKDIQNIAAFLRRADFITIETDQKEICQLISDIYEYELYHVSYHLDILSQLKTLLSDCISSGVNHDNSGYNSLKRYLLTEEPMYIMGIGTKSFRR